MLNIIITGVMWPSVMLLFMVFMSGIWLLYNNFTKLYFATNGPD